MNDIVIYSNGCQECERLKSLLERLRVNKLITDSSHEYYLGVDFTETQFRSEFGAGAEYPQVAIGNKHIGSMKDTLHYLGSIGYDKH